MRIVGGALKGRRVVAPAGRDTRPTSDRLRESLFNILQHGAYPPVAGARVADLFAGSGALGLEALSRGAAEATFVETARPALAALGRNIAALGVAAQSQILRIDATRLPQAVACVDIAFLDPPYGQGLAETALTALLARGWLHPDSLVIVETARSDVLTPPQGFTAVVSREVAGARLRLFRIEAATTGI